jgi:hypothetical protein
MRMDLAVQRSNVRVNLHLFIKLIILVVIIIIPSANSAQETKEAETALDCSIPKKISKTRPHPEGTPTEVMIGVFFTDIKAISDTDQTFTADVFRMLRWIDPRLSEKSLGRSLEDCEVKRSEIWHPDLVGVNILKGESLLDDIVDITSAGDVRQRQRFRNAEFFSDLDFRDFPFDTQVLYIRVIELEHEKGGENDRISF